MAEESARKRLEFCLRCLSEKKLVDAQEYADLLRGGGLPSIARAKMWYYVLLVPWQLRRLDSTREKYTVYLDDSCAFISSEEVAAAFSSLDGPLPDHSKAAAQGSEQSFKPILDSLHAVAQIPDYKMCCDGKIISEKQLRKALMIVACIMVRLGAPKAKDIFRILFLFCGNVNALFYSQDTALSEGDFRAFLLFFHSLANTNFSKTLLLLDHMFFLDPSSLGLLIAGVSQKKVRISTRFEDELATIVTATLRSVSASGKQRAEVKPAIEFADKGPGGEAGPKKSAEELEKENKALRGNIAVLLSDMAFFSSSSMITELKKTITSMQEELSALKNRRE